MSKLSKQEHAFAIHSKLNVNESKVHQFMKNLQFRCLSDLLSHQHQQAISRVLLWAARLNVIFIQAALDPKSLTGSSHRHDQSQKSHHSSCVHDLKLGRIADCYRRSLQMMLLKQKRALSWAWFEFSQCGALARFIGSQLSGSYIHLEVTSLKPPKELEKYTTVQKATRDLMEEKYETLQVH